MRSTIFYLLAAILLINCNKSDDPPAPHKNTLSVLVNGTPFTPTNIEVLISGSSLPGTRAVNVYATNANGLQISLHMYEYDGSRSTFTLDQNGSMASYCLQDCGFITATATVSNSGEIKITSLDNTRYQDGEVINGTFHFQTDDNVGKYSVTNGQFSLFVPER